MFYTHRNSLGTFPFRSRILDVSLTPERLARTMFRRIVFPRVKFSLAAAAWMVAMIMAVSEGGLRAQTPAAPAAEVHAKRDIAGDWQGTLEAGKSLRIIARIAKADKGWSAKMFSIDQTPQPFTASSITLDGSTVKFAVDMIGGSYDGTVHIFLKSL